MFALGLVVSLVVFGAAVFWFRQPNGRFSTRILGHDLGAPSSAPGQFLRSAPTDTARLLRALRTPNEDPDAEHDRQLTWRRFRIMAALVLVFGAVPLLFDLVGRVAPVLVRGGAVGVALLVLAVALLVYRAFAIAKPVVSYGNGADLDRRAVIVGAIGLGAIATVLAVTLALAGS